MMKGNGVKNYIARVQGFSRNAKLFLLSNFIGGMAFGVQMVVYNLFLLKMGYEEDFLGVVVFYSSIAMVVFALPGGRLSDLLGRRRVMLVAGAVGALSFAVQILYPFKYLLIAAVVINGAARTAQFISANPLMAESSTKEQRPHLFSVNAALLMASGVVGSVLGGYLPNLYQVALRVSPESEMAFGLTLATGLAFFILSLIPIVFIRDDEITVEEDDSAGEVLEGAVGIGRLLGLSDTKLIAKLALPGLLVGLGAGLFVPFVNVFFKNHLGATTGQIGTIFSVQSILTTVGILVAPLLAARIGKVRSVVVAQLLSIPFLLTIALSSSLYIVAAATLVRGALMNMSNPLLANFTMDVVKPRERATVESIGGMVWNLGWAVSAWVGGWLMSEVSYTLPYLITAVLYVTSSLLYYFFFARHEDRLEGRLGIKAVRPITSDDVASSP